MDARLSLILRCSLAVMVLALAVALLTAPPPARAIQGTGFYCSKSAIFDLGGANFSTVPVRMITADGTPNKIYICGYTITVPGKAANVGFVSGNGPACGATPNPVTPLWQLGPFSILADNSPGWRGILVPSNIDVCISPNGSVVQVMLFYEVAP